MGKVKTWLKDKADKAEEGLKNFGANFNKFVDEHPRLTTTTLVAFFVGLPVVLGICLPPSEEKSSGNSGNKEKEEDKTNFEQVWDFVQGLDLAPNESFNIEINGNGSGDRSVTHTYKPMVESNDNDNTVAFVEEPAKTYDVEV